MGTSATNGSPEPHAPDRPAKLPARSARKREAIAEAATEAFLRNG